MPQSRLIFAVSLQEHPELQNTLSTFSVTMSMIIIVRSTNYCLETASCYGMQKPINDLYGSIGSYSQGTFSTDARLATEKTATFHVFLYLI
jgi:hypothetical protein